MTSTEFENPVSNPSPLGLFGFGITTILLSLCNLGIIDLSMVIVASAITLGGCAEILAGLFELKYGNTFAGNVFLSFGLFWLSLVLIWILPEFAGIKAAEVATIGIYLLIFGVYALLLFISTLKSIVTMKLLFIFVTILFLALGIAYLTGIAIFMTIGGIAGVLAGVLGVYMAAGMIVNGDWETDMFKL